MTSKLIYLYDHDVCDKISSHGPLAQVGGLYRFDDEKDNPFPGYRWLVRVGGGWCETQNWSIKACLCYASENKDRIRRKYPSWMATCPYEPPHVDE